MSLGCPVTTVGTWFGFAPPSLEVVASIAGLVAIYLVAAELLKRLAIGRAGTTRRN